MKIQKLAFVLLISVFPNFFIIEPCLSQIDTTYSMNEARNAFYFEIVGNGLGVSANYERSLYKNIDFRVGVGYILVGYSIPAMINFSIGKTHKLELGAGGVYAQGVFFERFDEFWATAFVGYRYRKPGSRFILRLGFTPLFTNEGVFPYGGLSIGHAF